MSSRSDTNIREGVAPYLQPDEPVITALIASVRGHQQAMTGGAAGSFGASRAGRARTAAAGAGIELAAFMAFVLTPTRLVVVETGNFGKVKRLLNQFDLAEVGKMTVKRLGLGASVTLPVRGTDLRLESRVGASRAFAGALETARAARA